MGKTGSKTYYEIFVFSVLFTVKILHADENLIEINRVAAKVDGNIVTWGEIERSMDQLNFTQSEKKLRASEFVDGKVDRLLATLAFTDKGMAIPESFIEQEYNKRLISEFKGDRRLFRDYLQSKGQTISEYKDEIREEIIYQHMLSSRRRMKADVSPDRVESYYKENAIKFRTNAKVKLREIVLKPIADEPITILMQQATKILSEIKDGKPFEDLAKNYGQSLYRENGGDWGVFVSEREVRSPEIREQAFALEAGEVSKPFNVELLERKSDGSVGKSGETAVYILKVTEKESSGIRPLSELRGEIEAQIARDIEASEQRKWLSKVKEKSFVRISLPQ